MSVTVSTLSGALARAERFLLEAPVLEALLARREAGQEAPDDAETADLLMAELFAFQLQDGSFDGSLVRTADALLLLGALQPTPARDERSCARSPFNEPSPPTPPGSRRGRSGSASACTPERSSRTTATSTAST